MALIYIIAASVRCAPAAPSLGVFTLLLLDGELLTVMDRVRVESKESSDALSLLGCLKDQWSKVQQWTTLSLDKFGGHDGTL